MTNPPCAAKYEQCGGKDQDGNPWGTLPGEKMCCIPGFKCEVKQPEYYSQCTPLEVCSNARFGQCGGIDQASHPWNKTYHHDTCCPDGFKCQFNDQYYSQCVWDNVTT